MKKRTLTLVIAVMLVAVCAVGGTLAWLMDTTDTVTNTFTTGDVDITLTETPNTDSNNDGENDKWEAQLIPGKEYDKDPTVSIVRPDTDVDCYLFVKFEENNSPAEYLDYVSTLTTANGWTKGDGTNIPSNVWYRTVGKDDTTISWELLVGNKVTVKGTLKKEDMPTAAPELVYTAYAVQVDNLTAAEAWDEIGN